MATHHGAPLDDTLVAGADLSAGQFKAMQITSDYVVKFPTAALGNAFGGVLQDKPAAAGRACRVITAGRTKAYLGTTLTIGQRVYVAASGWFGKVTSGYAAVGHVVKTASSGYVGEIYLAGAIANVAVDSVTAGQI